MQNVAIGIQDYAELIENAFFYIDKTDFIKEWWEAGDSVTLISRPRRFGKTLTMSMVNYFFSNKHVGRSDLFEKTSIWKEEKYRKLQGTYPVIFLSFAGVKETNFADARRKINDIITGLYVQNRFLLDGDFLYDTEKDFFRSVSMEMDNVTASIAVHHLTEYLSRYYHKKVIILLDEYDTPLQEAYVNGYWKEMVAYTRSLFNNTLKTNPSMERAIMTGITRVSKESIFSDLNNMEVVTTTSEKYAKVFGFTEKEVFEAMDCAGLADKNIVKKWYDGFTFGNVSDIYNPWSVINYLDKGKCMVYWANTSKNALVGKVLQTADASIKDDFHILLEGGFIETPVEEEIVFDCLDNNAEAIWSLLLTSGYLKVVKVDGLGEEAVYTLALTNYEVSQMFYKMVKGWFKTQDNAQKKFLTALQCGDIEAMNIYLNMLTRTIFSYYDVGNGEKWEQAERFYHGFTLGLLVELSGEYTLKSNRESGFGRYDVMLIPNHDNDGIIIEFKAVREDNGETLESAVSSALQQIEQKAYEQELVAEGIPIERIRKYGFAFEGKKVLIGNK